MKFLILLPYFKEKKCTFLHILLYLYGSVGSSNTYNNNNFRSISMKSGVISLNSNQSLKSVPYRTTPFSPSESNNLRLHNERVVGSLSQQNFKTSQPVSDYLETRQINRKPAGYQKLPLYPPMGTLGTYGNEWFPDEYKNNHRNLDK